MKKINLSVLAFLLCLSQSSGQGIRKPVWAGQFYEKDASRLSSEIDSYLKNVKTVSAVSGEIRAIIVPHAGYVFSAQTAACAYSLVQGKNYDAVVIIGPSHRIGFAGCSVYPQGGFETPLGVAKVDAALAAEIMKVSGFSYIPEAHEQEHSIEVQVPFIQKVLPQAAIVPIVMGYQTKKTITTLAEALARVLAQKNILVVVSTDMSHFLPKSKASEVDAKTISLVKSLKVESLIRAVEAGENILCGGGPVAATLLYLQKKGPVKAEILGYADSTAAGGPDNRVVGYMAAALTLDDPPQEFSLSQEDRRELLDLARSAVITFVREKIEIGYETRNPNLLSPKGAFVTLKKNGRLRGCIGFIEPLFPLYKAIVRGAIYAAVEDRRFEPVSPGELDSLEYEISVLTPLKQIYNPNLVQVGKHGLVISQKGRKGLLLPQVPIENGWDRDQFLEETCLKAGLPPDAWKRGADIFVFEAIVFH